MCRDLITRWACNHEGDSKTCYCGKPFPECNRYWNEVLMFDSPCSFCNKTPSGCFISSSWANTYDEECDNDTKAWKMQDGPIRPPHMSLRRREILPYRPRKPSSQHGFWGKKIEICQFRKSKHTGVKLRSEYANWMYGWRRRLEMEAYPDLNKLPLNQFHELALMGAELPDR
ncbi:hypothetical protein N431DRAFT_448007 [Stipitochalara longipes BDJ]|nr:hypothetical protein N431DRAFT_448007 [Stipitochalara longipes BDJ]